MRNDIHSPKNLVPADYDYVAPEVIKIMGMADVEWVRHNRELIAAHMKRTGGTYSHHSHGGNCGVCGNVNAIYTVLFYHAKSNSYVRMGQECAELVDRRAAEGLNSLRDKVRNWREAEKGKNKAKAVLTDAGLSAAWDVFNAPEKLVDRDYSGHIVTENADPREERIIRDIVGKLVRYGSVSDKQMNFVRSLLDGIAKRPEREAKRAAEREAAAPCPAGRVEIAGEILSKRVDDGPYGKVTKMLVRADSGFKVWGTMPAGSHGNKGDRIVFKATVKPSEDDPKFGFASRPKLISIDNDAMVGAEG